MKRQKLLNELVQILLSQEFSFGYGVKQADHLLTEMEKLGVIVDLSAKDVLPDEKPKTILKKPASNKKK